MVLRHLRKNNEEGGLSVRESTYKIFPIFKFGFLEILPALISSFPFHSTQHHSPNTSYLPTLFNSERVSCGLPTPTTPPPKIFQYKPTFLLHFYNSPLRFFLISDTPKTHFCQLQNFSRPNFQIGFSSWGEFENSFFFHSLLIDYSFAYS